MTEISLVLVNERMLLGALREQDAADASEEAQRRAEFLAQITLKFGASLDQELTYAAIAEVALPEPGAWCIVDVIEAGGGLRRLAVVHPDPRKQATARGLIDRWTPADDDPIGVPAVRRERKSVVIVDSAEAAVVAAARDPETLRVLRWLGPGWLLVVPIVGHGELLGAITFVSRPESPESNAADIALGEAIAARCAQALEAARLYAAARGALAEAEAARADAEIARAAAEAADSSKTQFLNRMSHELRTPLNAIGGYAQLLEMGVRGPVTAEQLVDLASIQRSQAHLLGLVDSVLNYAQLGAGRVVYATANMELVEVVQSVESFVAPQMRAKSIGYSIEPCDRALAVRADAAKVRQIVLNLIGNAIKFTPAGGHISVTCGERDRSGDADTLPMCTVSVTDSGIGIPAERLDAIFDPFVQVDRRLTSSESGVGLGLAISRDLARGMGGDITVQSVQGVGTTFTVALPSA
ncbi:MAG: GAF domain-containing sensor histidine kinase [Gemmatimonadaceae bacterium]